jgi:pyruvate dehydrogenase E2 component (dihydrolipoamide acetyltransferase)
MALLQEIKVPLLSVNDTSLTVVSIPFPNGHKIRKGENIMVFETSKTTYDVESETEGYILYTCTEGSDYEVNEVVARIFSVAEDLTLEPLIVSDKKNTEEFTGTGLTSNNINWQGETIFSKDALQWIETHGIDKSKFAGKDFVSRADAELIISGKTAAPKKDKAAGPASKVSRPEIPVDETKVIVEKLSSSKKREIRYLSEVQSTGLTSTIHIHVETCGIFVQMNRSLHYLKDSLLPVIIYECGRLLRKYPLLNAYSADEKIAVYRDVHVGFAVDIDKGLKVLKIGNADRKQIGDIENEILSLSNRYLDDVLTIDDLSDITFTITDLSMEGIAFFQPLVNMMNSAILGVSSIDEKLQRCILSLTFDHRITEGKLASRFLSDLKSRLESYRPVGYAESNTGIECSRCRKTLQEDLGDIGFVKCITPAGKEGYLCQSCFKGF